MYFSGMEIQWLTQQISSICTPEPRFNLSAPKTTVSRNLTGLGLGFLFSFSNQVPSLLIFTLCLYWKYFFFFKETIYCLFCFSVCRTASNWSVVFQLIQCPEQLEGAALALPISVDKLSCYPFRSVGHLRLSNSCHSAHFTSGGSSPTASNGLVHIVDKNLCL